MALPNDERVSEAEYLAAERASDVRHEYINGEVIATPGASWNHSMICFDMILMLGTRLKGCVVPNQTLRVKTGVSYRYPDLIVMCGPPKFHESHNDTLLNPEGLVEVLSPSTEAVDRGKKWEDYQRIPTLKQYLIVSQDKQRIEAFTRQPDGTWQYEDFQDETFVVLGTALPIADIYANVIF